MSIYLCLTLGLIAGISSGFLGIGGGTIIIPALVYLLGFTQHQAQGTTLALMVPPIGLLAAIKYYLGRKCRYKSRCHNLRRIFHRWINRRIFCYANPGCFT